MRGRRPGASAGEGPARIRSWHNMAAGSGLEKRDRDDRLQALHISVTLLILTTIPRG